MGDFKSNQAVTGLSTDSTSHQQKAGSLTFALNSIVENFDGNEITYQREQGTEDCLTFPRNLKVIGRFNITQIEYTIYFLTNKDTGESEIGKVKNDGCEYETIINSNCLNFSVNFPIHQIVVKQTNCGIQIYWTDNNNDMRYLDLDNLPWVEHEDPNNDYKSIKDVGNVDCNKLLVQPNFSIPYADVLSVEEGGNIIDGSYQFVAQYANEIGEGYTSFYNVTNPISIHQNNRESPDFNLPTSKAIRVEVKGLDNSGLFDYFNLVVIETINLVSTPKLVGTYPISKDTYEILYTGDTSQSINVSPEEIFLKYQYYNKAGGVTSSDDRVIWYDLTTDDTINYQPLVSKIKVYWESYKIPYNKTEGYYNPINTFKYRSYLRDEVYPLEICFLLRNGKQTNSFILVNRTANDNELSYVDSSNKDTIGLKETECSSYEPKKVWETYNTAYKIGSSKEYIGNENNDCYKGPYEYGEFSYWESEDKYPNNKDIWGDLAGKPIRLFKFPDELVSPRFSTDDSGNEFIYPIGVKIDIKTLYSAILESDLTQQQKDDIVGFKLLRGDRSSGNKSIIAKGHFTNVGKFNYEEQDYYFPNYPYNSLQEDPLFANQEIKNHTGYNFDKALRAFETEDSLNRFTFHSPDTHFYQPIGVDSGMVKMESIDYGKVYGHFVQIKDNAQYKFTTQDVQKASIAMASGVAFEYNKKGRPSFNGTDVAQTYTNMVELFEKLIPYQNFGYSINSYANLNKSYPIPNNGFKIRDILTGRYLTGTGDEYVSTDLVRNINRESSVYVRTGDTFKKAHEYNYKIPEDNSRFIATNSSNYEITLEEFFDMAKTNSVSSLTAVVLGCMAAANDLANGSNNAQTILTSFVAQILQKYLDSSDYDGFLDLENKRDECSDIGQNLPHIYIENPQNLTNDIPQVVEVTDENGNTIGEDNTYSIDNNIHDITSNQNITLKYIVDEYTITLDVAQQINNANITDEDTKASVAVLDYGGIEELEICGGELMSAAYKALVYAMTYYTKESTTVNKESLSKVREYDANAYYGSIKSYQPAQWGSVYSYSVVDCGVFQKLKDPQGNYYESIDAIFGGDTFINKFALKIKQQVFDYKTVGLQAGTDIDLKERGSLGYPMFYISTKPLTYDYDIDQDALSTSFSGIGLINKNALYGSLAQTIGGTLMTVGLGITAAGAATGVVAVAGLVVTAVGALVSVIGSIFSNIGNKITKATIKLYKQLFQQIIDTIGIKNINFDMANSVGIAEQGIYYHYVYGIPNYFVESGVNVDMRQAYNDTEGNFYPNVSNGIPDNWVQEANVPIIYDNTYTYNQSFSKQNKENYYNHLREDFDPEKLCTYKFPNRALWSEKTNLNETLNNWLIYKPLNRFDLPKSFGKLVALNGIMNRQIIARFEDKTQIYNALTAINTNNPLTAFLGNSELFTSTPPLDFGETDTGVHGSQHKFFLKTEQGIVFADAKRGTITLLQGQQPIPISSKGNEKWFANNLPFQIDKYFNEINIDNNFNGIGLHGVYDDYYNRLIITKLDYKPIVEGIKYSNGEFYTETKKTNIYTSTNKICNAGFLYDAEQDACVKIDTVEPTSTTSPIYSITNPLYGHLGGVIFNEDYDSNGNGTVNSYLTTSYWKSKVNTLSKWVSTTGAPLDVWIGFNFCVDIDETKTYYIGITADDRFKLSIDDNELLSHSVLEYFYLYPVTLTHGSHKISIQAINHNAGTPGMIACEIYDNDVDELQAATSNSDLNIVFTTRTQTSFPQFDFTCPSGYELVESAMECGVYFCRKVEKEPYTLVTNNEEVVTIIKNPISLEDKNYFENLSWTMSYSFLTNSWISWHSYLPNYYTPKIQGFQSGLNSTGGLYTHNKNLKEFNKYYGTQYPFIIEYPYVYSLQDEVLQSVKDYCTSVVYDSINIYTEPDEILYFNKAILYNRQQSTGYLNLVPEPKGNPGLFRKYPLYKSDSKDILISKRDNFINFNAFWDIVKDKSKPLFEEPNELILTNLNLNTTNYDYTNRAFKKATLRAKDLRIRLILDDPNKNYYQLITRLNITETIKSHY